MRHERAAIAYDGYSYWWVCTCRAYGPCCDSWFEANDSFIKHLRRPR